MNADNLTTCKRCGSDACYTTEVTSEIKNHLCFGCGFQTTTVCTVGSDFLNEQMETLPDLYKELAGEDEDGLVWIPSSTQTPEGLVFAKGTGADNWKWAVAKFKEIDGEKKMDMINLDLFEERDYMEALDTLGIFNQ